MILLVVEGPRGPLKDSILVVLIAPSVVRITNNNFFNYPSSIPLLL